MSILDLPCELYLLIADHLTSPRDVHHLLLAHRGLANFMRPVLFRYASHPTYAAAALYCFAANRNLNMIQSHLIALQKWGTPITTDAESILAQGPNLTWESPCEGYHDWNHTLGKLEFRARSAVQRALHWAVINNKPSMIQLLLSQGAEVDYRDPKTGGKAIDHAIRQGSVEIVKVLIDNGADVTVWEPKCGSLLHCMIGCMRSPTTFIVGREQIYREIMLLLLKGGANIAVRDTNGQTALHLAILCWNYAIPLLLEWGADVNARDGKGNTPLHLAVVARPPITVPILLKHGADPTIKNMHGHFPVCLVNGLTPYGTVKALTVAAEHHPVKCCRSVPPEYTTDEMRLIPFRNMRSSVWPVLNCSRSTR